MAQTSTVREVVFQLLRSFGVTTVFGNPGSTELPMFRDFPADFRYVLGLQESVVLGMADGFAQATRNAALVNLHSAVGLGHALGNLFTASQNYTPLLVTAGQQARSMLPHEAFLRSRQASEFPRPYVKWSCEPARAEDVPSAIAHAYHVAMQAPCGPTFVSIPVDDWDRACTAPVAREVSRTVRGETQRLAQAATALAEARRPVLVAGAGVARDSAWRDIVELAERHQSPVWVSPMSGRNSFPEDHPLFAGFLAADRARIVQQLQGHDLIVVLGAPVFVYHVEGQGPFVPDGAAVLQLTDDAESAASAVVGTAIVTGIKAGIRDLLAGPPPRLRPSPSLPVRAPPLLPGRLTDAYLLQQIAALRPAGSIIVEEAPSSRAPMHDRLPILHEDGFYTCASGGLGYGLPAAIGVAMGRPRRRVIAVLGDGSSMYSIQGIWSAAQLQLPISFVIIRNGGYQALNEFKQHFGLASIQGVDLPDLDFCALARAQGVPATRVSRCDELDRVLQSAFASAGPMLVEVLVERSG